MKATQLTTYSSGDLVISSPDESVVLKLAALAIGVKPISAANDIPAIGEYWPGQGGVNAGLMRGENGKPDYWLIVPTDDLVKGKKLAFGGYEVDEPESASRRDGLANTLHLVEGSDTEHPAAQWCDSLTIEGHNDLYLPAIDELALCRANVPELFEKEWHWSSSQRSANLAFLQYFDVGGQTNDGKDYELRVRPVRRFIQ
ncbi:DUF1566 domain-containing protein [Pseudomonas syringae group genomosp. 3]|uniref:DUF1566 domain-containing protein n=1 Tax=Pseudomonas syringae group genomosp. 3 TaxID=251701 RepID=UPI001068648F|nr:DUF1566 domain-containing protein [Pseudomonas syringae group genomosp. 3]TES76038.1 DUF1566 domain-containing protein [Pseudomonas syringae pv. tomato]